MIRATRRWASAAPILLCAIFLSDMAAQANKANNTLRVAVPNAIRTLDGIMSNSRQNLILMKLVDDTLLEINPQTLQYQPLAAKSYTFIDQNTLEFDLRDDLTFHDGSPFGADDVVYTFKVILNRDSRASQGSRVSRWLRSIEKTGPFQVRLHMKKPYPLVLRDIATSIPMRKKGSYHAPGTSFVERRRQRDAPIGLGPYRIANFERPNEVTLALNPNYRQDGPKGKVAIERIVFQRIKQEQDRLDALRSKKVDWVLGLSSDKVETLTTQNKAQGVSHVVGPDVRIKFLSLNPSSNTAADNPFAKTDVRRAVNHAINRGRLARDIIGWKASVIHAACHPKQFGCPATIPRYRFNPALATRLLVKAGYPDGFEFILWVYRDLNIARAIAKDLERVGINATIRQSTSRIISKQRRRGNVKAYLGSWGSGGAYDSAAIAGSFWTLDASRNMSGDQVVAAHMAGAESTSNRTLRRNAYQRGFSRIADQAYWVPLSTYPAHYVYSSKISFTPPRDGLLRFYDVRWK